MRGIVGASFSSLFGLALCAIPLIAGIRYALWPSERALSIMRPLTMAAMFSALCSFVLAIANGALTLSTLKGLDLNGAQLIGAVLAEVLAPVVASLACLTVA